MLWKISLKNLVLKNHAKCLGKWALHVQVFIQLILTANLKTNLLLKVIAHCQMAKLQLVSIGVNFHNKYLAHVIEQPNFRIPNPQYLQRNFRFDFFNDSENTF